jgi:hypothetical protein
MQKGVEAFQKKYSESRLVEAFQKKYTESRLITLGLKKPLGSTSNGEVAMAVNFLR